MTAGWRPSSAASRHLLPARGEKALPSPTPLAPLAVKTGDMLDRCARTWWTHWLTDAGVVKVELHYVMVTEEHVEDAIVDCGTDGNGIAAATAADAHLAIVKADVAVLVDLANLGCRLIFDRRQQGRHLPGAGLVTSGRYGHSQRLVGPIEVVAISPGVELPLSLDQVTEGGPLEQLLVESAMESLIFALGLRVVRSRVTNPDAEPHQERSGLGQTSRSIVAPR